MSRVQRLLSQRRPPPGRRPSLARPTPPPIDDPLARWQRHHQAFLAAEIRQLVLVARTFGPLQRTALARLAHAERWHDGCFDAAVQEAIRLGRLRQLPFDYLAPPAGWAGEPAASPPTDPAAPGAAPARGTGAG